MGWYETPPVWMTQEELEVTGQYQVDTNYKPVMTAEQVLSKKTETVLEHYKRIEDVMKQILEKENQPGPIIIIGHGVTIDAAARPLLGRKVSERSKEEAEYAAELQVEEIPRHEMDKMGLHYPYCCCVALEECSGGAWRVVHNALPPITYLDFSNRMNHQFFNRP